MAHAHDDEIVRRDDDRALTTGAVREVRALGNGPRAVAVHPEEPSVDRPLPRRRRRADERCPAFGQQTLSLPDTVLKIEEPDARPVARRAVVVAGQQKVAVRIGLEYLAANADAI